MPKMKTGSETEPGVQLRGKGKEGVKSREQ
jgi:hypothetical protein